MVAQLHLALVMAIDASCWSSTSRRWGWTFCIASSFYDSLLNDYFDRTRRLW